jgi:prepilin-type N-terminal cleavage/methylation domain-containing protein
MIATLDKGITLIELVTVISIIGVLAIALGFEFKRWIDRYMVEVQIDELYADLMNARMRAIQRNRAHFVTLAQTEYTVQEDIDPWPYGDTDLTAWDSNRPAGYNDPIPLVKKNLNPDTPITWSNLRVAKIKFNNRGLSNMNKTICFTTDNDADYDCLVVSATRIRSGKLNKKISDGGECNSENCVKK